MYLPVRLHVFTSVLKSGIETVLLDKIDPYILNVFLAMDGSYHKLNNTWTMRTEPL